MFGAATNLNFHLMCRTCMLTTDTSLEMLQDLYAVNEKTQEPVAKVLKEAMPKLNIEIDDELPKTICSTCLEKLLAMYDFQHICYDSEVQLRSLVDKQFEEATITSPAACSISSLEWLEEVKDVGIDPLENNELQIFEKTRVTRSEGTIISNTIHECPQCGKAFKRAFDLKRHLQFHVRRSGSKAECVLDGKTEITIVKTTCKCEQCGKAFKRPFDLKRHMQSHDRRITLLSGKADDTERTCQCVQCGKKFKRAFDLKRHQNVHERENNSDKYKAQLAKVEKPFVCEYCNKAFLTLVPLKIHLRVHTGEKPYLCAECGRAFKTSDQMKVHLQRHSGLKPHECPDCPKKFRCKSDLIAHRKQVHDKLRPHSCEICGDIAFRKLSQLKQHMKFHNNEKPYKCEFCDMRFVWPCYVQQHARRHTGEKPYTCNYCPATYSKSDHLKKHLRVHLGENIYRCELCPQAYRLAVELREHATVHMNESEETRQRNLQELKAVQQRIS